MPRRAGARRLDWRDMSTRALELLPQEITEKSISEIEIVVPIEEALMAADIPKDKVVLSTGWEGWPKTEDGRVGRGNVPQGTMSLEDCSVEYAAEICRKVMAKEADERARANMESRDVLHYCIGVKGG